MDSLHKIVERLKRMILRDYKKEDAPIIAGWLRSEEELYKWSADRFNKYPLSGNDINESYVPQLETGRFHPLTAVDDNGEVIGHFIIRYPRDDDDSAVRFGFIIVNPALRGKGCGKEMLRLAIAYVKERLSALRIDLCVFDNNESARHCYEAAGFTAYAKGVCQLPIGNWHCTDMALFIEKPLETKRMILRRWKESDAEDLYRYARDPDVGPIAGWPPHQSVEESLDVIKKILNGKEAYAICLKGNGKAIGAIELKLNGHTDMTEREDECELGYWLGKPFWGLGLMPEAAREILRRAFEDLGMAKVWCGYYEGNTKSKRVQEKVGFKYQWTTEGVDVPLMHEKRTGHVNAMTKGEWIWKRLYEAAQSVQNARKISEYVEAGGVAAAILSPSGKIYTGVCVDTCSTLGICAERNAIFNMIANGEQEIRKVIAIMPDGKAGAPCGACRELMVQLMPEKYKNIEIMLDYETGRTITLGEITPEWWIH